MADNVQPTPPPPGRQLPSYMKTVSDAYAAATGTNFLTAGGNVALVAGANGQRIQLAIPAPSKTLTGDTSALWTSLLSNVKSYFENPSVLAPQTGTGTGGFPFDMSSPQGRVTSFLFFQGMNPNTAMVFMNPSLWSAVSGFLDHMVASFFGPDAVGMPEAYMALQSFFQNFRQIGGRITAPGGLLSSFSPVGAAASGFVAGFSGGMFDVFSAALQMKIFSFSGSQTSFVNAINLVLTKVAQSVGIDQGITATKTGDNKEITAANVPLRLVVYAEGKAPQVLSASGQKVVVTGVGDNPVYIRFGEVFAAVALISKILDILATQPASSDAQSERQRVLDYFDSSKTPWQQDSIWLNSASFSSAFTDIQK